MKTSFKSKLQTILNQSFGSGNVNVNHRNHNNNNNNNNSHTINVNNNTIHCTRRTKPFLTETPSFQPNPKLTEYLSPTLMTSSSNQQLNFSLDNFKPNHMHKRSKSITKLINKTNTTINDTKNYSSSYIKAMTTLPSPKVMKNKSHFKKQIDLMKGNLLSQDNNNNTVYKNKNIINIRKDIICRSKGKYSKINRPIAFNKEICLNNDRIKTKEDCFSTLITKRPINKFRYNSTKTKNFFDHMKTEYGLQPKRNMNMILQQIGIRNGSNEAIESRNQYRNDKGMKCNNNKNQILTNLNFDF